MDNCELRFEIECRAELPRLVIQIGMPPEIQHDLSKYVANRNALEKWKREADANHEANLAPMEHNAKNAEIVTRFLSEFIVMKRTPGLSCAKISVPGYVADLRVAYPTSDGYDKAIEQYKLRIETLEGHERQIKAKEKAALEAMIPSNLELAARHLCIAIHDHTFSGSDTQHCEMVPLALVHNELVEVEKQLESMSDARKTNTL